MRSCPGVPGVALRGASLPWSQALQEHAARYDGSGPCIVIGSGLRTADVMEPGKAKVSTAVMGEAIVGELEKRLAA